MNGMSFGISAKMMSLIPSMPSIASESSTNPCLASAVIPPDTIPRFFRFFHGSTSLSRARSSPPPMASANEENRAAAGILRLLMGLAGAGAAAPTSALPRSGGGSGGPGLVVVQHVFLDGDGDLFSGGVGGGVPPASKAAIAALKEVKAEEVELGECAICLDGVEDAAKEMPCGHRFHGGCLEKWLGVHGNCPVCRRELPPAAKEEENNANANAAGAAAEGGGGEERRRPRAAVVVSYLVLGGEAQQQQEREEPWNIRIEDVD